ncbi:MAG: hypothetical protein K2P65_03870 [Lachnospiraceae bacterium]|nr:hypothetical protein [Lachnospiraceae bacterium]
MTSVFEEKNISKAIARVGLPAMLGQLTTLIYNIADTFFCFFDKRTGNDCRSNIVRTNIAYYYVNCLHFRNGRQ